MQLESILSVLTIFLGLIGYQQKVSASTWSYTGNATNPEHWSEESYPVCDAFYQSPIDIVTTSTILDRTLPTVRIVMSPDYNLTAQTYSVTNNGHSLKISFPQNMWYVSLRENEIYRYSVVQMHFHWGSEDSKGSEHTLDGKCFAMESHIVAYDTQQYSSYAAASTSPYGHAVLGFWSAVSESAAVHETQLGLMGDFEQIIKDGLQLDESKNMNAFDLAALMEQVDASSYYRYQGSLTTPPCTQNVIWTVFTRPVPILSSQLATLRKQIFSSTESRTNMADNYRPVLALNPEGIPVTRNVYRSDCTRVMASGLMVVLYLCSISMWNV